MNKSCKFARLEVCADVHCVRHQVLCDCDCAVILKSGPTVTCKEGRFMAYCSKDLECLMRGKSKRRLLIWLRLWLRTSWGKLDLRRL